MKRLTLSVFLAVASVAAAEDEITMKNGDRITGKVVELAKGKLAVDTAYAGNVKLDWAAVASVKTDHPVKVKLDTGEIIEGPLSAGDAGKLRIGTPSTDRPADVDPAKVKSMNEPPVEWHGLLEFGARATEGNTRTVGVFAAVEGTRESEIDKFTLRAYGRYGRNAGVINEQNAYGIFKYQYKFSERLYGYAAVELFHDKLKDLRLRSLPSVGVGFVFLKEEKIDLWAEAGLAYTNNDYFDNPDRGYFSARANAHLRIALPLGFEFIDDLTYYPSLERSIDFLGHNEAALGVGLGKGWTFRTGVITDYDNTPPEPFKKFDNLYFVTLGYKF